MRCIASVVLPHLILFPIWLIFQLHEVGHVLGIGPMWTRNGLIPRFTIPCPYKTDSEASREYQRLSGCTGAAVPVEMSYNPQGGSNCGHWQEKCFQNELMSPTASLELPLSRLTIAGLEDLGYEVNYNEAEPFGASQMDSSCLCNTNRVRRRTISTEESKRILEKEPAIGNGDNNMTRPFPSRRRELSEEGRSAATSFGQGILAMRKDSMSLFPVPDEVYNLGQDVVFVLFEENETLHSVVVTSDSL